MSPVGTHHLADLHGIEPRVLQDEALLVSIFGAALDRAGFHVLRVESHRFAGGGEGVTGVFLLSESHLAFHTYPEYGYLALDLFSCGSARPEQVLREVLDRFSPRASEISSHPRGARIGQTASRPATAAVTARSRDEATG